MWKLLNELVTGFRYATNKEGNLRLNPASDGHRCPMLLANYPSMPLMAQ